MIGRTQEWGERPTSTANANANNANAYTNAAS